MYSVPRKKIAYIGSLVSEYPAYILSSKLLVLYEVPSATFESDFMLWVYRLDIGIMLYLWALFLQSVFSRHPIYEATKFLRNETSTVPPSVYDISFWLRFNNPFWEARNILLQDNICYATDEEIASASLKTPNAKSLLSLDIHQHPSFPRDRPVVLYIHGGEWTSGSKDERPPLVSYLTLKQYVVVSINHRLAPSANVVEQLIDVKRAIRWVKQNISKFGGNASFLSIAGSSSGGHLATMAAMTQNDPQYQPGFESVDTTIHAVVSIAGYYDVTRNWGYKFDSNFTKKIAEANNSDSPRLFSPTWRLKEAEANKSRLTATPEEKLGLKLPPFMVIHGKSDVLAPIKHARDFKKEFMTATIPGSKIIYVELPSANHYCYGWSSPRAHSLAYGIEPFLRTAYEAYLKQE
ncbi:hypothetical protein HDV02_000916 [Globomyces sp. JEL0801]|nr:hypothetical protein HDV02_000916 [Globomyces sp. JEL0801]